MATFKIDTDWIREQIKAGNVHAFYKSTAWKHLRQTVLKAQNHECQLCKAKGIYKRASTVHHVNHLRTHPELALSVKDGAGQINLLAVCDECHYSLHHSAIKWNDEKW